MGKEEELKKLSKKNSGRFLELDDEFKELVNEIKTINREPRASAILVEAYIGYVCDKLLEYRFETNALEDLPLRTKREILVKLGIITKGMSHDLGKIQDVRNIYAHRRKIKDHDTLSKIEEIVKSTKIYSTMDPSFGNRPAFELFLSVGARAIELLRFRYGTQQITEINKFHEKYKDEN